MDELNFAPVVARTDANGRFRLETQDPPSAYFLFAGWPRYGRLAGTTFGQTVVIYRKGERVSDVVIPAIRATELTGHVYGRDGTPIAGCWVSALTRGRRIRGGEKAFPYDRARADDPSDLRKIEDSKTDADGAYVFSGLGADRYLVSARCKENPAAKETELYAWAPVLYPDANLLSQAEEIVLMPGGNRSGVDFHLRRERVYRLEGKMTFSDGSPVRPGPENFQDLLLFRSTLGVTSTWLGEEDCFIYADDGKFRCDSIPPGEYTFYAEASSGDAPAQAAKIQYSFDPAARQILSVQLHNRVNGGVQEKGAYAEAGGYLDFEKPCLSTQDGRPAIQVLAWGSRHVGGACYYMNAWGGTKLRLPEDEYRVNAFEAAFVLRDPSYLGSSRQFENLLMRQGSKFKLHAGQEIEPRLRVLTTAQLVDIAQNSVATGDPN